MQNELEERSMTVLCDIEKQLAESIESLRGTHGAGLCEHYRFHTASYVHAAVEGYIWLRKSGRVSASKHLVRTCIEAFIRLEAVKKKPNLLGEIAFAEFGEDLKWARSLGQHASDATAAINRTWNDFKSAYSAKYPGLGRVEELCLDNQALNLRSIAEQIGMQGYYDSHYRLYCRFTHAAFRASTGSLGELESEDNRTMALCALGSIEALALIGAPAPNMEALRDRLARLDESPD